MNLNLRLLMLLQNYLLGLAKKLRGCFRSSEGPRNSLEHELNHGQVDEGLPSAWQLVIVLAEPPAPGNPGEGALHHPTPGE